VGSRDPLLEFWDRLISRERLKKLQTSNLVRRRMAVGSNEKKMRNWVRRGYVGSRDPLLEFWDPLISRERSKLETSNLSRRRTAVSSNEKDAKLGHNGSCGGHVTHFWNFWIRQIS